MVQIAERNENYFTKADHGSEVIITSGEVLLSSKGSEYLQLEFESEGKEGDTGYNNYITEKALPYTAQRVQGIIVHNEKTEADKEKVRKVLIDLPDAQFGEWALSQLKGKKAYLVISFSDSVNPRNGLPYLERNLQGYEPKPLEEPRATTAKQVMGGGDAIDLSEIPF